MAIDIFDGDEPRDLVHERLFDAMAAAKEMGEPSLRRILDMVIEAREGGRLEWIAVELEALRPVAENEDLVTGKSK